MARQVAATAAVAPGGAIYSQHAIGRSKLAGGAPCRPPSSKPTCRDCALPPRQSARCLRPGRPAAAGEHRPHQRVRLGAADADSRQGPRADAAQQLLVSAARRRRIICWKPTSRKWTCRRAPTVDALAGRTVLVRKTEVVPIECVVRAYLSGSAWQEYQRIGPRGRDLAAVGARRIGTPAGADVHAGDEGGAGRARRKHLVRRHAAAASAPSWRSNCGSAAWTSMPRAHGMRWSAASSSRTRSSNSACCRGRRPRAPPLAPRRRNMHFCSSTK